MDSGVMLPPPTIEFKEPFMDLDIHEITQRAIKEGNSFDRPGNRPDQICDNGLHVGNPHCGGGYEPPPPPPHHVIDGGALGLMLIGATMLMIKRKMR